MKYKKTLLFFSAVISLTVVTLPLTSCFSFLFPKRNDGFTHMKANIEDYRLTNRGAGGVITIKVTPKTGDLVNMKIVKGDEDIIVITNNGTVIRTSLEQVRLCGRNSQGVKIINLKENEVVSSFTILPKEDCLEEEKTSNLEENPAELN